MPDDAYLWQQKGKSYLKRRQYDLGVSCFDSAVKYAPERYTDYRGFMKCIFQKSYASAIADFEKAEIMSPGGRIMDHPYLFYMAICNLQLDNLAEAYKGLSRLLENERSTRGEENVHYLHYFYMAMTCLEMDKAEDALVYLAKCLALYPRFSDGHFYKAKILTFYRKYDEALGYIRLAAEEFAQGYSMNEDNALYEAYPYQVNKFRIAAYGERIKHYLSLQTKQDLK